MSQESSTSDSPKFPSYKDHLNKSFLEELSYKLWSTKGARFLANKRLLLMNDLSNKALGFLSAYLIILGLISVYQISSSPFFNQNVIAFGSTAISILLLAFSLMEHAQDYKMRAHNFHECAVKIGKLHSEVRIFQTLSDKSDEERVKFCEKLNEKYQTILELYSNHDSTDFDNFRLLHGEYYQLDYWDKTILILKSYFKTKLLYHALILSPPLIGLFANYL